MGRSAPGVLNNLGVVLGHYDDVFVSKFKKMIYSSFERSRTPTPESSSDEDTASETIPPPSPAHYALLFEKFVNSLDEHDPFVIALLDVLVKEVSGRAEQPKRRHDGSFTDPRPSHRMRISFESAEALRKLLRNASAGSSSYQGRRAFTLNRSHSHMVLPDDSALYGSSSGRAGTGGAGGAWRVGSGSWVGALAAQITDDDANSDVQDPLFDAYYGDTIDFGVWRSRYGRSPPPGTTTSSLPVHPPISSRVEDAFSEDWSIPAPSLSGPPSNLSAGPSSSSRAVFERLMQQDARIARASDFATYSARRRAVQRSESRPELAGSDMPTAYSLGDEDAPVRLPITRETPLGSASRRRAFTRPISPYQPPRITSRPPTPPSASMLSAQIRSPPRQRQSLPSFETLFPESQEFDAGDMGSRTEIAPPRSPSSRFDDLRHRFDNLQHRLESYPRRGSVGYDDQAGPIRPSSLSIRPSTSSSSSNLLLTQGRPILRHERERRSHSPPGLSSFDSSGDLRSDAGARRPLRRPLRVPEMMERGSTSASTALDFAPARPHLSMPRHSSGHSSSFYPAWAHPRRSTTSAPTAEVTISDRLAVPMMLDDSGAEVLYRSPSPMPPPAPLPNLGEQDRATSPLLPLIQSPEMA
ncbi:hypothetical protein DL93DRAFT_2095417 [Clavulina sp. PMI_390]|nr:hypothetical protein DL93DRAFT_2095417 [Clavulina sp. PMI_390]